MKMKKLSSPFMASLLVIVLALPACSGRSKNRETLFQISTIGALTAGLYDGAITLDELSKHGDIGIGTFEGLDGEMLMLDGMFYQIKADGKAHQIKGQVKSPYSVLTFFDADLKETLPSGMNYAGLKTYLDGKLPTANIFYAFKIKGRFGYMKTRSVPAQRKPYPPLVEVTSHQPVFEFTDVRGTLVGFRYPAYASGLNVPGYHLHFLTDAADAGGHVIELAVTQAEAEVDYTPELMLMLPGQGSDFYRLDLSTDRSADIQKVQK